MEILFLLKSLSSSFDKFTMFSPSILISPLVGTFSRLNVLISDDFPLPLNPTMTNISPSLISKSTCRTPTLHPVDLRISSLEAPSCIISIAFSRLFPFPKISSTLSTSILIFCFCLGILTHPFIKCIREPLQ